MKKNTPAYENTKEYKHGYRDGAEAGFLEGGEDVIKFLIDRIEMWADDGVIRNTQDITNLLLRINLRALMPTLIKKQFNS